MRKKKKPLSKNSHEKDNAEQLLMRYEKVRTDVICKSGVKKENRFDLALIQSGGMIALMNNAIVSTIDMNNMKETVEGLHEIGSIIGRMARAKITTTC